MTATVTVPEADGVYPVDDELYHADRGSLSVSGAKLLLPPSCPAKFRQEMDNERKPKKVWDFGHVAHKLVLGKGAEIAVLDPAVHGLKANGEPADKPTATAAWKQAEAEARGAGQVPVSLDDYRKAEDMAAKVLEHPEAADILSEGVAEMSMYITDPDTGIRLRARADWLKSNEIGDYKTSTTANPIELQRKFWQLGYHMQAAWYTDVAVALGLMASPRFRFIVQEKEPPYLVTVIEYDAEDIEEGRRLNRIAINLYAECMESGRWPGYGTGTYLLRLPPYALQARNQAIYNEAVELERTWDDNN